MENQGEIILYQPDREVKLEVRLENETVWLNRIQLAELFARDVKTIGKHINNALKEELADRATVAKFAIVQNEGGREVTRHIEFYNLDMILSVGYRVKSNRGVEFRRWANKVLKEYLLKGYSVNQRLKSLEEKVDAKLLQHDKQLDYLTDKVDFFVRTSLPPVEGVFYDGQIFDAYKFATDLIRTAKKSILLIDNYVDDSVLLMLSKRDKGVVATIYTHGISNQLNLDIQKYNSQYPRIDVRTFKQSHDRFLIIDNAEVYHIGASLKDLGKKMFAFSKLDISPQAITDLL
jgi:hypothetical protein